MRNEFVTWVNGELLYRGDSLEIAIRIWDSATYNKGISIPGGISIQTFSDEVMVRDGWILHVQENGVTYLSPTISV